MNLYKLSCVATIVLILFVASSSATAQLSQPIVKRTITKTDSFEFGAGGTVSITSAPNGSIKIIGGERREVEITAVIELQAANEADLNKLALVTGFFADPTITRIGIISFGTYNKLGDKKLWKKFPKNLMRLPVRIDYVVRVPRYCDLEIDGGKGDLSVSGVEGSMRINFLEANADVAVIGGAPNITVGKGVVNVALGVKGWRGRGADIKVGSGELNVKLPSGLSAEIDATILRSGLIDNGLLGLKPRDRKVPFSDKSIVAKAGVGGASIKLIVGDGTLRLEHFVKPL